MTNRALTQRAASELFIAIPIILGFLRRRRAGWHAQKLPAACQFLFSIPVAEEAIVADALETIGQHVQQETADELLRLQRHRLVLTIMAIVLIAERDVAVIDVQQAIIRD